MFEKLYPELLWKYFLEIAAIPRPSHHEERITDYLVDFAKSHQLAWKQDDAGNVLIRKQAVSGRQNAQGVVLQSHVDMVCEKNADSSHNFMTDPIQPYVDGEWVKARQTTLGADDGVGVAAMLAVLVDSSIKHGPLECLFTVDEESGLTGAFELKEGFIEGKILLNLDSEDEGELFIGCAGGIDTMATFKNESHPLPAGHCNFRLGVTGLKGGHSGDEIHKGLGNAIQIATRFLLRAIDRFSLHLCEFNGGNLKNAIPREAFAVVSLSEALKPEFIAFCVAYNDEIRKNYVNEEQLQFSFEPVDGPKAGMTMDLQDRLLNALDRCPHGVISWSKTIEGLVETSTNLASVKMTDSEEIIVTTSQRSSVDSERLRLSQQIAQIFQQAGAATASSNGYPGWEPRPDSAVVDLTRRIYEELFHTRPKVKAIHAGLECGLFLEKYPELDMISFGPTIKGAHSPDERLHIPSVAKFWDLLRAVMEKIE